MTGNELIEKLQSLSPEELELQIELYLGNAEDGEPAKSVEVITSDNPPYYKGDNPWKFDLAEDEKLLYIKS